MLPSNIDWFKHVWAALTEEQQTRLRHKAEWERMSLRAVMIDWPVLVPDELRHLVPRPADEEDAANG